MGLIRLWRDGWRAWLRPALALLVVLPGGGLMAGGGEVNVGYLGKFAVNWPLYAESVDIGTPADAAGAVQYLEFSEALELVSALREGRIDAIVGINPDILAVNLEIDDTFSLLGGFVDRAPYVILERQEIDATVQTRRYGYTPWAEYFERFLFEAYQREVVRDISKVEWVPSNGSVQKLRLLRSGQAESVAIFVEYYRYLEAELKEDKQSYRAYFAFFEFPFLVTVTRQDWGDNARLKAVQQAVTADLGARLTWLHDGKNKAQAIDLLEKSIGVEHALAETFYDQYVEGDLFARDLRIHCDMINKVFEGHFGATFESQVVTAGAPCRPTP